MSSVACSGETTAENATSLQVTVSAGENVTCTITNVRKARLTVNKVCQPANDPGNFVLAVNPGNHTNAVGCGGGLGPVQLSPGGYTVSETAGLNTNLGDYVVTINGACASDGSVTLAAGQSATCTVTNAAGGSIRVTKSLDPVTDSGKFDLLVGADVVANEVGNGGNGTRVGWRPAITRFPSWRARQARRRSRIT